MIHEIPISLWVEVDRIFSVVRDRCQVSLHEKHGLRFVTAVFGFHGCFYHGMSDYPFAEIVQYHADIEFTVRRLIGRKNTIAADTLHADNVRHFLPNQVCKSVKTFVTAVKVVGQSPAPLCECMEQKAKAFRLKFVSLLREGRF